MEVGSFSYEEMTKRNIGFVSLEQQVIMSNAHVVIFGVGGMGGACFQALIRAGIQKFTIADLDQFEVSNFNRQVFANMNSLGKEKKLVTFEAGLEINPNADIKIAPLDWEKNIDQIIANADIIVNGTDDIRSTVILYRACRRLGKSLIDAFASPLPSVYLTGPNDQTPEEWLGFPTKNKKNEEWLPSDIEECRVKEFAYIIANTRWQDTVDVPTALKVVAGQTHRISFAPMVITTGNLMAYAVIQFILRKPQKIGNRGVFFNPLKFEIERPWPKWLSKIFVFFVMKKLRKGIA